MTDAVRLSELLEGCARRSSPLAAETALFIALQAAEALRATTPRAVSPTTVRVNAEGGVEVDGAPNSTEPGALLGLVAVLEAAVSPLPAGARETVRRVRSGELATLGDWLAEVEALLVPLNRGAAKRVLGRLAREHEKEREREPDRPRDSARAEKPAVGADALLARENDAGPTDTALEEAMPPLPPPPRLGSLTSLGAGLATATDTEPDSRPLGESAIDTAPDGVRRGDKRPARATDTVPDDASLDARDDARDEDPGDDDAGDDAPPEGRKGVRKKPSAASALLGTAALWLVGAVVGGAVLFVLLRALGR